MEFSIFIEVLLLGKMNTNDRLLELFCQFCLLIVQLIFLQERNENLEGRKGQMEKTHKDSSELKRKRDELLQARK